MDITSTVNNIVKQAYRFKIKAPELKFRDMRAQNLSKINKVIIHHSANDRADDTAKSIHATHLGNNWAGIGYHFLIRANGTIEKGRPQSYAGAHCEGANTGSLGVCLSGNFERNVPTAAQIQALIWLLARLQKSYNIKTILPHSAYAATACPGKMLRDMLYDIIHASSKLKELLY